MDNLFKTAVFGDRYVTRDGRLAIFSHTYFSTEDKEEFAILMIQRDPITEYNWDGPNSILVSLGGTWHRKKYESPNDIVSHG